ncbi:hypothetical protein A2303_01150 [Candidatus Falkowbacteria bacterium RIFOXYB2_FULL_47_14]|uniref:GIY-YIG domain-containing protein n=1 Tax=Candidatus Falkowbacteria bacterium RIFOXYA2_FULL_47_19 TaxID=1797994 RepID=A0A1F5SFZ9_9BACT|nr:MAG: hypothetical protein A2227_00350 [Candidatus Falkowbacteria bacterium RIFOXYA2_FULL_47_19]OGF35547.1 MAG: hypothetical protein A2468_05925 [Candidatus Falkowbacteria bacterium RIFOXYC2_FULL_46_15]OGF42970.1 MAG: hypothetical protein A2303_01150 [Candidatus Falkowbacteria bacterium RIFOXYB2_FULL_47_14]
MQYVVYILQSKKDLSYYIGHTDNPERRIEEHNRGKDKYTKSKIPWTLVRKEFFDTRGEAMTRENQIKRKKSRKYIDWLVGSKS